MGLDLNEVVSYNEKVPYKEYFGPVVRQMPLLLEDRRTPLSIADILERRLDSIRQDWKNNHFDSVDAIAYHPSGKYKIVHDAQVWDEMAPGYTFLQKILSWVNKESLDKNPDIELHNNGFLNISEDFYKRLPGEELKFEQPRYPCWYELTKDEALAHPVWQELARDTALLKEYADRTFKEMKKKFGYERGMGVHIDPADFKGGQPRLRMILVAGHNFWSRLHCNSVLNGYSGRLIGYQKPSE